MLCQSSVFEERVDEVNSKPKKKKKNKDKYSNFQIDELVTKVKENFHVISEQVCSKI